MVKIDIVMPFTRQQNKQLYTELIADEVAKAVDCRLRWRPVLSPGSWSDDGRWCENVLTGFVEADWVAPFVLKELCCVHPKTESRGCEPCYVPGGPVPVWWKLNKFIAAGLEDDVWCWFCADDCLWSTTTIREMAKFLEKGRTGNPAKQKLEAAMMRQIRGKEGILEPNGPARSFRWDLSMTVVQGALLRQYRFRDRIWFADTYMHDEMGRDGVVFASLPVECCSYYNALVPEQWGCEVKEKR